MRPSIIVHGGAGTVEDARRAGAIVGCERAAEAGWAVLERGGSALDAVEAAVCVLEDDPQFNAGLGSVLNQDGAIETDACIMDGLLRAGAVAAAPWLRRAVSVARKVLEDGQHVILAGEGAIRFAEAHGIFPEAPEVLVTERSRARWEAARAAHARARTGDTVGACAVDAQGGVAAATSTGGINFKRPGRVGDSPLPGCGNYADARAGAASATGHGESIIRVVMAKAACEHLRAGHSPDAAARAAVAELVERTGGDAGIIVVAPDGTVGHHTSTPRMPWAAIEAGRRSSGAEPT